MTELVRRLRAMVLQLLPVEVSPAEIKRPTSRIISPQVVSAFMGAAGDFVETVGRVNEQPSGFISIIVSASVCSVTCTRLVYARRKSESGRLW